MDIPSRNPEIDEKNTSILFHHYFDKEGPGRTLVSRISSDNLRYPVDISRRHRSLTLPHQPLGRCAGDIPELPEMSSWLFLLRQISTDWW
jgi:hypothetical protein